MTVQESFNSDMEADATNYVKHEGREICIEREWSEGEYVWAAWYSDDSSSIEVEKTAYEAYRSLIG